MLFGVEVSTKNNNNDPSRMMTHLGGGEGFFKGFFLGKLGC